MCVATLYAYSKHEKQVSHCNTSGSEALSALHVFMKKGHKDIKKIKRSIGVSAYRHMKTDNQLHSQSFPLHENLDSFLKEAHWGYKTAKYYNHITKFLPQHQLLNIQENLTVKHYLNTLWRTGKNRRDLEKIEWLKYLEGTEIAQNRCQISTQNACKLLFLFDQLLMDLKFFCSHLEFSSPFSKGNNQQSALNNWCNILKDDRLC